MQDPSSREEAERLFLDQLKKIENIIRFTARRAGMREYDAEDFASYVRVRLIDNDYAVLQKFAGHCSFTTYITVVIQRILLDYRIQLWGKWHPSAEAKRLGPLAIELEKSLTRDGRSLAEALLACRRINRTLTLAELESLSLRLPKRTARPRPVAIDDVSNELQVPPDSIYEQTFEEDRARLSQGASDIVRTTLESFPDDDRLLLRLHFGAEMTIAEIARVLGIPQPPLYRRAQRCLLELRHRLESVGMNQESVKEILSRPSPNLDFGFESQKSHPASVDSIRPQRRGGGGSE